MMNLTLKTAPALEPLSLSEVKDYLKLPTGSGCNGITTYQSLTPKNQAIGTYTGTAIEVLGYTASVVLSAGTVAGTLTVKVQDSNDNLTFADVSTFTAITSLNDEAIYTYDYTGGKRYLRAFATVASDTASFSVEINISTGDTNEDTYITALITAARKFCEGFQNRAYITQTWELTLDDWPDDDIIDIPKGNLQSIVAITYKNSSGVTTTLANTEYVVSTKGISGRIAPAYGKTWPVFTPYPLDAITIEFTCGYGATAASVPETAKQAMYLLISHWYENRMPLADKMTIPDELNFSVSALLWQDRLVVL